MNCDWCGKKIEYAKEVRSRGFKLFNNSTYCSRKCRDEHEKSQSRDKDQTKSESKKGGGSIFLWVFFFPLMLAWCVLKNIFK